MIETINKLIRTSRYLVQELGRDPTPEEIADRMEYPVEKGKGSENSQGATFLKPLSEMRGGSEFGEIS